MIPDECDNKPDRDESKFDTPDKDEKKFDTPDKDEKNFDTPDKDEKIDTPDKDEKINTPNKDEKEIDTHEIDKETDEHIDEIEIIDSPVSSKNKKTDTDERQQYSDISDVDENGNPTGDNGILKLVNQSIHSAKTKQATDTGKKRRTPSSPPSTEKKRLKSDSEEEKSDPPPTTLPLFSGSGETSSYEKDLTQKVTTYRFLDQNINKLRQNVDSLRENLVSMSSCLAQAEIYKNNVKMSLTNLGIPEQILEEQEEYHYAIIDTPSHDVSIGRAPVVEPFKKKISSTRNISGSESAPSRKLFPKKHDTVSSEKNIPKDDPVSSKKKGDPVSSKKKRVSDLHVKPVDDSIVTLGGSPICISPLKSEPLDTFDFMSETKNEEIIVVSSGEDDDFQPLPIKQEPVSPKAKKKKKKIYLSSTAVTPTSSSSAAPAKTKKKSGDTVAVQYTPDHRVLCFKGCGKTFSNKYNMAKHVRDEVCTKDVSDRSGNFLCEFKKCTYSCVTRNALMMHYFGHLKIKAYACEVASCGKGFIHASSLTNHKHNDHEDIYGPAPCQERERYVSETLDTSVKKKKKPPPNEFFSSSEEEDK